MTTEQFAEELHRQYRAAEKAMNRAKRVWRKGEQRLNRNLLLHDHGWKACGQRQYFLKRATLILKRANLEHPTCLMEDEQRLLASVLRRRVELGI